MTSVGLHVGLRLYDLAWKVMTPVLKRHQRLRARFSQRTLTENPFRPADIWIQAASVGEAYLVRTLLEAFEPLRPVTILATSGTDQGLSILQTTDNWTISDRITFYSACFPFDRPTLMQTAIHTVRPQLAILLETEIWPGFIVALKRAGVKILLLNGRLKQKSLQRYRLWPSAWPELKPDKILAVSTADAKRFSRLFGQGPIQTMHNIKFDQIPTDECPPETQNPLYSLLGSKSILTLGSTRQEEEPEIKRIIQAVSQARPEATICLFPRHLHRIDYWRQALSSMNRRWELRSASRGRVEPGMVIVWDVIGELKSAYQFSRAVFTGGSLAPLGGQNFLEPLSMGVIPIMGPSWNSFTWVGEALFAQGLARIGGDTEQVIRLLIDYLDHPEPREKVIQAARHYFTSRKGGSRKACAVINEYLAKTENT